MAEPQFVSVAIASAKHTTQFQIMRRVVCICYTRDTLIRERLCLLSHTCPSRGNVPFLHPRNISIFKIAGRGAGNACPSACMARDVFERPLLGLAVIVVPAAMVVFQVTVSAIMFAIHLLMGALMLPIQLLVFALVLLIELLMEAVVGRLIVVFVDIAVVVAVMPALVGLFELIVFALMLLVQAVVRGVVLLIEAVMDVIVRSVEVVMHVGMAVPAVVLRASRHNASCAEQYGAHARNGCPACQSYFHGSFFSLEPVLGR